MNHVEWIACSERLPPLGQRVLGAVSGGSAGPWVWGVIRWENDPGMGGWHDGDQSWDLEDVSHWAEMPELP